VFNTHHKISTALHAILPSSKEKVLLEQFLQLDTHNKLFIVSKGLDDHSLKQLRQVEKELESFPLVKKEAFIPSQALQTFQKEYYFYFHPLQKKIEPLDVSFELQQLHARLTQSFVTPIINWQDPFELTQQTDLPFTLKKGKLTLKDYGYLTVFSIPKASTLDEYTIIYTKVTQLEQKYSHIESFSSLYYFVENSQYIKKDATNLVLIATLLLLLLYVIILRNISLLWHTLLTLGSAALFSTLFLGLWYKEISLFVVIFGFSISTVAVDYMFHHYFHGQYETKKGFNKEVFLGFFTTFITFFILSFTPFLLIKQIAQFAMISLLYSYLLFSFMYTRMYFKTRPFQLRLPHVYPIKSVILLPFCIVIAVISSFYFHFDFNIKSLDVHNETLKKKELFFTQKLNTQPYDTILIKAKSIDKLIEYNERIRTIDKHAQSGLNQLISHKTFNEKTQALNTSLFESLRYKIQSQIKDMGFISSAFKDAYKLPTKAPAYTYEQLQQFNIPIIKYQDTYLSYVRVSQDKSNQILNYTFAHTMSLKILFEQHLAQSLHTLLILGLLCLIFIFTVIVWIAKKRAFEALSMLLFPMALIFIYFTQVPINILHLFMFFIIIALGIDYAIYMSKDTQNATIKAILFSALSSFAGFGVLVFSNTPALSSIGSVASIGIMAILILIFFQRKAHGSNRLS
jgi:hypothetical protein